MNLIRLPMIVIMIMSITSCQKEPITNFPQTSTSTPPDPAPISQHFRVREFKTWYEGNTWNDTSYITLNYFDSLKQIELTEKEDFSDRIVKHLFGYDSKGNWTEEAVSKLPDLLHPLFTNKFIRNSGGDAIRFDYSERPEEFDPISKHQLFLSYKTLNGLKEITVVDTNTVDKQFASYYTVTVDAAGYPLKKQYYTWGEYGDNIVEEYFYDDQKQVIKKVVTDSFPLDKKYIRTTHTFSRDPLGNNSLYDFAQTIKGKNFWWFDHSEDYYFYNLAFDEDFFTLGKPLKEHAENISVYVGGVLTSSENNKTTYQNKYDTHGNLFSFIQVENGSIIARGSIKYSE